VRHDGDDGQRHRQDCRHDAYRLALRVVLMSFVMYFEFSHIGVLYSSFAGAQPGVMVP
jgi:hypothetical protein